MPKHTIKPGDGYHYAPPMGETRIVKGKVEIKGNRRWVPYPPQAASIIALALENGWGVDDGIINGHVRSYASAADKDVTVFVRILIGRERGINAMDPQGEIVQGQQFHMTWVLRLDTWETSTCYVKVGTKKSAWRAVTPAEARRAIAGNPVTLPSPFIQDEKEMTCL